MNAIQIAMTEGLTQRQLDRIERLRAERAENKLMSAEDKPKPKPFPYIPNDIWREIKSYLNWENYEKKLDELKPKIKEFVSERWTTRSVIAHFGEDLMRTTYTDYNLLTQNEFNEIGKQQAIRLVFGDKKKKKKMGQRDISV